MLRILYETRHRNSKNELQKWRQWKIKLKIKIEFHKKRFEKIVDCQNQWNRKNDFCENLIIDEKNRDDDRIDDQIIQQNQREQIKWQCQIAVEQIQKNNEKHIVRWCCKFNSYCNSKN